jgi:uncharacterized protein YndB with AHSA1/START domain
MRLFAFAAAAFAVLVSSPARAEVVSSSASAFLIQAEADVNATPAQTWRALGQIQRWWNPAHTYSGDARRLSLDLRAGGCWCERWGDGQSVQHGTVVLAQPGRTLRLYANLGPLQELPVHGVLTFTLAMQETKTILRMTYRVSGPPDAGLDKLAPLVDRVLGEQFKRLQSTIERGQPE